MSGERCGSGGGGVPAVVGPGVTGVLHQKQPPPLQGRLVRPEPVLEKSFVENVAGFINEVSCVTFYFKRFCY